MLSLIQNEWIKIFKQISSYIMIALFVLLIIASGGLVKYLESNEEQVLNNEWKQELAAANEQSIRDLEEIPMITPSMKEFLERDIAINEYRIEHDLPPETSSNLWTFISDSGSMISTAGLIVIIIAAGIVANEFSWGTVKILLVKPYKRWKILLAKYITVVLFLLLMLGVLFVSSSIVGAIFFGTGGEGSNIHLAYNDGAVEEQSLLFYLIKSYLLNSLSVFLLATMAFMLSAVFRVSGLAIGISIFLLLMGGTVTNLLASKFEWAKYSLFANTNLMQYSDGVPMIEGMTLSFSITMIIVYFLIFHVFTFFFFTKRDVAA